MDHLHRSKDQKKTNWIRKKYAFFVLFQKRGTYRVDIWDASLTRCDANIKAFCQNPFLTRNKELKKNVRECLHHSWLHRSTFKMNFDITRQWKTVLDEFLSFNSGSSLNLRSLDVIPFPDYDAYTEIVSYYLDSKKFSRHFVTESLGHLLTCRQASIRPTRGYEDALSPGAGFCDMDGHHYGRLHSGPLLYGQTSIDRGGYMRFRKQGVVSNY